MQETEELGSAPTLTAHFLTFLRVEAFLLLYLRDRLIMKSSDSLILIVFTEKY